MGFNLYPVSEWKSERYTLISDYSTLFIWKWKVDDSVSMRTVLELASASTFTLFRNGNLESIP